MVQEHVPKDEPVGKKTDLIEYRIWLELNKKIPPCVYEEEGMGNFFFGRREGELRRTIRIL